MTQSSVDEEIAALRAALYLGAIPSRCAQLRKAPLADGVGVLLRIVANDCDAIKFYAECLEKSPEQLREAAAFYLEQVMLAPGADSYRVLGKQSHAPAAELRRNLVLLCRWLHSDVCKDLPRSIFFLLVTQAWNDLKTPERRAAYDAALGVGAATTTVSRTFEIRRGQKNAKRSAMNGASREEESGKPGRERMIDPRKSHSKGLWRFIMRPRGWRAR